MKKSKNLAPLISLLAICSLIPTADARPIMNINSKVNSSYASKTFKDNSGLSFQYPASMKKQKPDGETIVKLSRDNDSIGSFEISVSINNSGISIPQFEKILHNALFSKMKNMKKTKLEMVYVGRSGRIKSFHERLTFTIKGIPYCQDYLFIPARQKIITFVLTTSQTHRAKVDRPWRKCLNSIEVPQNLVRQMPVKTNAKKITSYCDPFATQCKKIQKPTKNMTLEEKIRLVLPRKSEERFLEIPWHTDLLVAKKTAESVSKPLFIWIMDGNVLGAT